MFSTPLSFGDIALMASSHGAAFFPGKCELYLDSDCPQQKFLGFHREAVEFSFLPWM
jgi:hypothetical protein